MVRAPGETLPHAPPELRIVEATDAATVADFERAFIEGYPIPELRAAPAGAMYDGRVLGGRLRLWVGYLGERPVATASALADEVVNGIYTVATVPDMRRRGFGAAMTAWAVATSPSLPAVLEATKLGVPLYRRVGFTDVGSYDLWLRPR